jgi:hypothetical protein
VLPEGLSSLLESIRKISEMEEKFVHMRLADHAVLNINHIKYGNVYIRAYRNALKKEILIKIN